MKKSTSIFLFLIFISSINLFSQVTEEWVRRYNGRGNTIDWGVDIALDQYNNVYSLGYKEVYQSNTRDVILVKYNSAGNAMWIDQFNGTGNDIDDPVAVKIDNSANIYVITNSVGLNSHYDIVLIKYNPAGVRQWVRSYNGPENNIDEATSMAIDRNNNIYITGFSLDWCVTIKYNSSGNLEWVKKFNTLQSLGNSVCLDRYNNVYVTGSANYHDYLTIKYNQQGLKLWDRTYGGSVYDEISMYVCTDSSGNVYISGVCDTIGGKGAVTIKYDSSGNQIWLSKFSNGNPYAFGLYSMKLDSRNNPLLLLYRMLGNNQYYMSVVKYSTNGNLIWQTSYPGVPQGMTEDYSDNVYITGWDYIIGQSSGATTIKYDSTGIEKWHRKFTETSSSSGKALLLDAQSNLYFIGQAVFEQARNDMLTIKYSQPIGIHPISSEVSTDFSLSQNYPNPFNPVTKIKFDIPLSKEARGRTNTQLIIYDILGREIAVLVNEQLSPGTYEAAWDGTNLPSGVYFYKLITEGFTVTKKMVLLK